uniref:RNA helicase n=1 Tax=Ditylum brightwellii TaxID=49249 RepID=A0A7S1ZI40_9STRA
MTTPSSKKGIDDASLLAPCFVPLWLRQINTYPVNQVLHTRDPPNMLDHIIRIYQTSVASCPQCLCKESHNTRRPWIFDSKIPIDYYYALGPQAAIRTSPNFRPSFKNAEDANGRCDYVNILNSLLREENEEKMILYENFSQYGVTVQTDPKNPHRATIEIPGIHDARPSIQPGDKMLLRPHYPVPLANYLKGFQSNQQRDRVEIRAEVIRTVRGRSNRKGERINDRVILTWLDSKLVPLFQSFHFNVRFIPSNIVHQRCLAALTWLSTIKPAIAKELLYPTKEPILPDYSPSSDSCHGKDLNEKQSAFVQMVLTRTAHPSMETVRPPMVLTGPAGTGKTKTLLVSILRTLEMEGDHKKRILVCTPSHTAADVLTRRLGQYLSSKQLFRMYEAERPVEMVPAEMLQFTRQGAQGGFTLPLIKDFLAFQVIVCTCSDAHIFNQAGFSNRLLRVRRNCLATYIQSQIQRSHLKMSGEILGLQETHFTHLFIDEAAQATEPETLIPLSVVVDDEPNSVKVEIALAGDPRQLSPNIYSRWAADGLQTSILERLLRLPSLGGRSHLMGPPTSSTWTTMDELIEYSFQREDDHKHLSVFLTMSYRGHPSLLIVPSKLFYFDKLRSIHPTINNCEDKWCSVMREIESMSKIAYPDDVTHTKQASWPIHFRGVIGHDLSVAVESFWGSNSWSNEQEAEEILQIVQTMVREGVSTQSIGIMAAFRAQVLLIRRLLRSHDLGAVNVGMVEDYQSVEREVIVLSLTRSNESFVPFDISRRVGLYMQPKRVNVALTRAEKLLIVVGNPKLMKKDKLWGEFLLFCRHYGCWYGEVDS